MSLEYFPVNDPHPLVNPRGSPCPPQSVMAHRYLDLIDPTQPDPFRHDPTMSHEHLRWMCWKIVVHDGEDWPKDKVGRWLGFVQGILAAQGLIDVGVERDYSRPLFHAEYVQQGLVIPKTLER